MGRILPFITGAAVGALAALAFAPQAGEQTRALVAEKANAVVGEAKDFGAGAPASVQDAYKTVRDKGATLLKDAPTKAQELASSATARVKDSAPASVAPESNDELREKIEAARRRIAAQVMENAEKSKALEVAAEAKEAAADVVEATEAAVEEAKAE